MILRAGSSVLASSQKLRHDVPPEALLYDHNMMGISGIDGSWRNCWAISSQRIESLLSWMLRERRDAAYPQWLDRVWASAKQATAPTAPKTGAAKKIAKPAGAAAGSPLQRSAGLAS